MNNEFNNGIENLNDSNMSMSNQMSLDNSSTNIEQPIKNVAEQTNNNELNSINVANTNNIPANDGVQSPIDNFQFAQNVQLNQQNIQSKPISNGKFSNKNIFIIVVGVLLLLLIGVACYYFINLNNPRNLYRNLIKEGIDKVYNVVYQNDEKISANVGLDFNLDIEEGIVDSSILDLINKTTLKLNYQMDKKNEQVVIGVDSSYDKESLINLQLFMDSKKQKTYLYAKDFYDKYLAVDLNDGSVSEILKNNTLSTGQTINSLKAKDIVVDELTSIIKDEDCSKEGKTYIFEISQKELVTRLKTVLTNLKNNDEFLKCYEDSNLIKEILMGIIQSVDESGLTTDTIKISIDKKLLSNKIEKFVMNSATEKLKVDINGDKSEYEYISNNDTIFSGYVKNVKNGNEQNIKLLFEVPELGSLTINLDSRYVVGEKIDTVDSSKVKQIDEVTELEQNEIMNNIQKSKIYELVSLMLGDLNNDDFDMTDDFYVDDNDMEDDISDDFDEEDYYDAEELISGTTVDMNVNGNYITLNIPEGFTKLYSDETTLNYKNEYMKLTIRSGSYNNKDDYFNVIEKTAEHAKKEDYYKNVLLSETKTKIVDGVPYYYKDYTYDFDGPIYTTNYYEKYFCTDLGDNDYLIIEMSSQNQQIPNNIIETILSTE